MTEPPIKMVFHGRFHTSGDTTLSDEPGRPPYRKTAKQLAFRALTSGKLAAQLLHVFRVGSQDAPMPGEHHVMGSWLIADSHGNVTAHRGQYIGPGGPWDLANAIVPGSAHAVRRRAAVAPRMRARVRREWAWGAAEVATQRNILYGQVRCLYSSLVSMRTNSNTFRSEAERR